MLSFIKSKETYFFLLILVAIGVGLQILLYKVAILALLLQWLISADYKQKFLKLRHNNFAVGLISLYFLYAISFFWSGNKAEAIIDIVLKAPLLILPMVILSQKDLAVKQINQVFLSFALSSVLINLFCFGDAYFSFLKTGLIDEFYYHLLTINMHTAYQSMFTCFSIVLFVYLFIKEKFISAPTTYIAVAIQMIFILLFSSRMQILIMIVIIPVYLISHYYKRKKIELGLLYTVLIFGFSYLIINAPSSLNHRYKQTVSDIGSIGMDSNADPRKFIWNEGLELIKDNWIFGAGLGDIDDFLVLRYSKLISENPTADNLLDSTVAQTQKNKKIVSYLKEKSINSDIGYQKRLRDYAKNILEIKNRHYQRAHNRAYNFHNQYLQTFGAIGVFGLLLLCYLMLCPIFLLISNKNYLGIYFLFIIGSSFLTESMFERQAGIAFFCLFYVFLIGRTNQNKSS